MTKISIKEMKAIRKKRVYSESSPEDGYRILVDRIWPRGVTKEKANLDEWMKEIAPSTELRKWFKHDEEKFEEFKKRYLIEIAPKKDLLQKILEISKQKNVTLLFGAKNEEFNQVVVLIEELNKLSKSK